MNSFEYWYDRSQKILQIVISIGLVGFLVFSSLFSSPHSDRRPSDIVFLLPFIGVLAYFSLNSLAKLRIDGPAIEGDEYGLIIREVRSEPIELAWNEISSIRIYQDNDYIFGHSSRSYGYNRQQRLSISHYRSSDEIVLKLYEIQGDPEDILADIMALAPSYVAIFYEAF